MSKEMIVSIRAQSSKTIHQIMFSSCISLQIYNFYHWVDVAMIYIFFEFGGPPPRPR